MLVTYFILISFSLCFFWFNRPFKKVISRELSLKNYKLLSSMPPWLTKSDNPFNSNDPISFKPSILINGRPSKRFYYRYVKVQEKNGKTSFVWAEIIFSLPNKTTVTFRPEL